MTHSPFAPGINNAVSKNEPTGATYEVAAPIFFNNMWVLVLAVGTDESDCKVGPISGGRRWQLVLCCERERLRVSHDSHR